MQLELYDNKAQITVNNFLNLTKEGFYDGLTFHRVIKNFMIQGGDPLGNGLGGPGYNIQDEFRVDLRHDKLGILSMANKGIKNTGGSQFFITLAPTPWLDGKHTIFGKVIDGYNTLRRIGNIKVDEKNSKPIQDVIIKKIKILNPENNQVESESNNWIKYLIILIIVIIIAIIIYYKIRGKKVDSEKEYVDFETLQAKKDIEEKKVEEKNPFEEFK